MHVEKLSLTSDLTVGPKFVKLVGKLVTGMWTLQFRHCRFRHSDKDFESHSFMSVNTKD